MLEEHPPAQRRIDSLEVARVDRQPPLVRLARTSEQSEAQFGHPRCAQPAVEVVIR
jgi:hypothetical protein